MNAIKETAFSFKGQTGFYKGKVRDVYTFADSLVMVATDRISAFDVVLPEPIPYKGQVLNQLAAWFLEATQKVVPNWLVSVPDENVSIGIKCQPYPVEMVVRAYLVGHAWREYQQGKRQICGVALPNGLKENDKLPNPIITPSTKASAGHDEDISAMDIIAKGLVPETDYRQMEAYSLELFRLGTEMAAEKGLILADTKYEFGVHNQSIYLIDEVHTPDSSRYFYADGFAERQENGQQQVQLSKEFVRQWLIENNFMGKPGQTVPYMSPEWVHTISDRYITLFEYLTGKTFQKPNPDIEPELRISNNVSRYLGL
jgi:phosphoribosylaminoimidazole-succinocarboxamide synthase